MSAAEIIEQIKTLPPREQEAVFDFVRQADASRGEPQRAEVRYVDDQSFEEAAARVFETHDELFKRLAK
jgi:hypothetical protein